MTVENPSGGAVQAVEFQAPADDGKPEAQMPRGELGLVYAIFFFSGVSALIYQVVWTRQLSTLFGATIYAVATVLTAFMGGLALGSWLIGRWADRSSRPLVLYASLELGIGLSALAFPLALKLISPIIGVFYTTGGKETFAFFNLVRFALSFLILLVPTTFMGATLPVMSKAVTRRITQVGQAVGGLYALNTAGAVTGVFLSGFLLMERLGIPGTTYLAVTVNVLVAALAFLLGRRWLLQVTGEQPAGPPHPAETAPGRYPRRMVQIILATYLLSGLIALAYEVAWTRSLIYSFDRLKATTYSFAGMLTVFLLGLSIGSAVMQAVVDRVKDLITTYAIIQFLLGISGGLSVFLIVADMPSFLVLPEIGENGDGVLIYWNAVANVLIRTVFVMGVPTLLMGMAFPVVTRIVVDSLGNLGREVGQVYAMNTLGAIAGSFLAGFVLIPAIGITWTIGLLSALSVGIATVVVVMHPGLTPRWRPLAGLICLLVMATVVGRIALSAEDLRFQSLNVGEEIVFYREGALATVSVIEDSKGWRTIYVDGVGVAGTDPVLQTDQKTLAHVPMVLLGGKADKILTVGFGSGGASWSYALYPEVEEIHAIEITTSVPLAAPELTDANHGIVFPREMVERAKDALGPSGRLPGARYPLSSYTHEANPDLLTFDPRYSVIVDDARSYLRFTDLTYDVIATDCTDLRYKTNANLYDLEYFQLCRERISDDGLVVVWTPLGGLSDEAFRIVVRTFYEVFPRMTVWYFANQPTHYCLFIAQKGGLQIDYERVLRALDLEPIKEDLEEIGLRDPAKLVASFVTDERGLMTYLGEGPLNTENHPILEFLSPRYGYDSRPLAENMGRLFDIQVPVWDLIETRTTRALTDRDRIDRIQQANDIVFEGHCYYRDYNFLKACQQYLLAKNVAPSDRSIDRLLDFPELQLLLEHELLRNSPTIDGPWVNAQWIAYNLGRVYELQERYSDAVTAVSPFVERMPLPSGSISEELREVGYALNVLLARCFAAAGRTDLNARRARGYLDRALEYDPAMEEDWEKTAREIQALLTGTPSGETSSLDAGSPRPAG